MDACKTAESIERDFPSITSTLSEYIRIPNLSPSYDVNKTSDRECEKVIELFVEYIEKQSIENLKFTVERAENRTPLICVVVEAFKDVEIRSDQRSILMYGHLDKQPPFEGWEEGLGPYKPVIKNGRLYGRGGADDGYAFFSALSAIKAVQAQKQPHPRIVVLIEASEESGSPDLPFYLQRLNGLIGDIGLVVCLDSGAGDYEGLWLTTSLRGILVTTVHIQTLTEGVHSGNCGGIASDSFRIARAILSSLENELTGVMIEDFTVEIPPHRIEEAKATCEVLKESIYHSVPLIKKDEPIESAKKDILQLYLNNTWRPCLTVTGQDGLPSCAAGGNVLRPSTSLKLSIRLPPTFDHTKALQILQDTVNKATPTDALVALGVSQSAAGFNAPLLAGWLVKSLDAASSKFFGRTFLNLGVGGSIPFMKMLLDAHPCAQFVVTGVLGPHSNAHGPNEFLDIEYCKKLTCSIAHLLADSHGKF